MATLTPFRVDHRRRPPRDPLRTLTKGRLRLGVIQVLVLALFLTLFGRLWYLQIFSGDDYRAQAPDQSVRDIVVQPARGLIVDDMGRPLVANRTSWVVTVDRTMLHRLGDAQQRRLLQRIARAVHQPWRSLQARTLLCGDPAARAG